MFGSSGGKGSLMDRSSHVGQWLPDRGGFVWRVEWLTLALDTSQGPCVTWGCSNQESALFI
ncbi:hypothetical protein GCM10010276_18360 [Streptomyces longisporus]|uniref:Uncharacterized protein n=1 Tax=Streptomyces longisporus TaxID=1948 RepID=A0ABN3LCC5_STRLO